MNKSFYSNCIVEDRKTRQFLDFKEEQWLKAFLQLSDKQLIEEKDFGEKALWRKNVELCNKERKNAFMQMKWKMAFPNIKDAYMYIESFSLSKEMLDLFISVDPYLLMGFLYSYKSDKFGNMEEINQKEFPKVNLPLIRMMDYFLEQSAFRHLAYTMERLEDEYIILWFELTYDKINRIIKQNIHNPNILYIFQQLQNKEFIRFFKKENLCIMRNATVESIYTLLHNATPPEEYLCHKFFLDAFKNFTLREQIYILDLMEEREYRLEFVGQLRKLLNKKEICQNSSEFLYSTFQMKWERVKKLLEVIEKSSYFSKNDVKESIEWQNIISGWQNTISEFNPNMKVYDYYSEIMKLYQKCRKYATSSIVSSLYPLNTCSSQVTHIQNKHFNILARVRTMWECEELEDTFEVRTFCSFSILTEKNMSHYSGGVLYGYYTDVSEDLIAHIYPIDSLSKSGARFECDLTDRMNMLLDIEDLNQATLQSKTYNQLCIRTKCKDGKILWPDCIVCIDRIDETSQAIADKLSLKIVVLHKNKDTIERNDDIYAHLK